MTSLFLTLLAPVVVLWIGAAVFYVLDHLVQPRDAGVAEILVLCLAIGALLWGTGVPGEGRPYSELALGEALADVGWTLPLPTLRADASTVVLALMLLGTAVATSLASIAESGLDPLKSKSAQRQGTGVRSTDPRVAGRAGRTATLGAALLFTFAGDWATMALAWVVGDLVLLYARPAASPAEGTRTSGMSRTVVLSLVGAICLGLVAVVQPTDGGSPGALATGLAVAALVLRLLPYPLPAWSLPFAQRDTLLARVFSFLVPTLLGAHLCSHLAPWVWGAEVGAYGSPWLGALRGTVLAVWAAVALLVSAFRAWSAREPGRVIASTTLHGAALILLGSALNLPSSWLRLVGAGAVLNVCALYVSWTQCPYLDVGDPRSWWRVVPTGVAILSMAGVPLTLGFPARAGIYAALLSGGRWLVLPLLVVAEAGVLGALLRVLLDVECVLIDQDAGATDVRNGEAFQRGWQREVAYGAGAALALGILALGVVPPLLGAPGVGAWLGLPKLPAWVALLLPLVGAVLLYRDQERITAWMEDWAPIVERLLDVRWVYRGIGQVIRTLRSIVWNGSLVVEGAGYMAWVTLVGLVLLLLVLAYR